MLQRSYMRTNYFEQRRDELFSAENVDETLELIREWKSYSFVQILQDVDLDTETKSKVVHLFFDLQFIQSEEIPHAIYVCALYGEWSLATFIAETSVSSGVGGTGGSGFGWKTLRKLIGNWDLFRDRKQLKELSLLIMKLDPKAMIQLNRWATQQAKNMGRVIKGYCDLCVGDSQKFAMMYSEL